MWLWLEKTHRIVRETGLTRAHQDLAFAPAAGQLFCPKPSQLQTPPSTCRICSALRLPTSRTSHATGTVTSPCASNAPGFKNRTGTTISKFEPRTLVVCGTSVTIDRSLSPGGTLSTRQGRTFAVIPRSTSHTSPRGGAFKFAPHGDQAPETPHLLHVAVDRCWVPCRGFRWAGATGSRAPLSALCAGAYRMRTAVVEQRLSWQDFTQS